MKCEFNFLVPLYPRENINKMFQIQEIWLFVVWMGLKTMRIVLNEMKPSFKP